MAANTPYDAGKRLGERFPMPDLDLSAGNRGTATKTAQRGLFFGKKPTRAQLEQDAETGFFFEEIGYKSSIGLLAEIAEVAEGFGYDILARSIRQRIAIRLEGSPS
ncbi:MAG TPA: hypothetical protein VN733_07090 [Solirubrobacterales bacterium]|nr:hypothetical protein [Solirubrobacterales bacterium]